PKDMTKYSKKSVSGGKSHLGNILSSNLYLIIARTEINLGKYFGPEELIKQNINPGKGIFIFDCDGIQKPIVHTQPEAFILLFHKECRTAPRLSARTNVTLIKQLLQLFL